MPWHGVAFATYAAALAGIHRNLELKVRIVQLITFCRPTWCIWFRLEVPVTLRADSQCLQCGRRSAMFSQKGQHLQGSKLIQSVTVQCEHKHVSQKQSCLGLWIRWASSPHWTNKGRVPVWIRQDIFGVCCRQVHSSAWWLCLQRLNWSRSRCKHSSTVVAWDTLPCTNPNEACKPAWSWLHK